MIKLPSDIAPSDVHQWLNDGWFVYNDEGQERVCQLYGDSSRSRVPVIDVEGNTYDARLSNVYAHWPTCGAINLDRLAVMIERRQRRQYRRTYNSRQTELVIPRKWEALKLYGEDIHQYTTNHPEVLSALFHPVYPDYMTARQQIESGEALSRALSPHVIIAGQRDTLLVYYRGVVAGKIEDGRFVPTNVEGHQARRILKHFRGGINL